MRVSIPKHAGSSHRGCFVVIEDMRSNEWPYACWCCVKHLQCIRYARFMVAEQPWPQYIDHKI